MKAFCRAGFSSKDSFYIVRDDPERLTFTVSVDDRRFASLGSVDSPDVGETEIRRRYATRLFRQRLHQREFRERVVRAYQHHPDRGGEVPLLVIDGRPFTWDQVGRMLMAFEGFTLRAVVDDTIEVVGGPLLDEESP